MLVYSSQKCQTIKIEVEEEAQAFIYVCDYLYEFSLDNFKWIKKSRKTWKVNAFRALIQDSVVTEETKSTFRYR